MHQRRLLMCAAIVLMEMTVCTHLGVQFVLISTLTAIRFNKSDSRITYA